MSAAFQIALYMMQCFQSDFTTYFYISKQHSTSTQYNKLLHYSVEGLITKKKKSKNASSMHFLALSNNCNCNWAKLSITKSSLRFLANLQLLFFLSVKILSKVNLYILCTECLFKNIINKLISIKIISCCP